MCLTVARSHQTNFNATSLFRSIHDSGTRPRRARLTRTEPARAGVATLCASRITSLGSCPAPDSRAGQASGHTSPKAGPLDCGEAFPGLAVDQFSSSARRPAGNRPSRLSASRAVGHMPAPSSADRLSAGAKSGPTNRLTKMAAPPPIPDRRWLRCRSGDALRSGSGEDICSSKSLPRSNSSGATDRQWATVRSHLAQALLPQPAASMVGTLRRTGSPSP